jgi:hypothetical protein
MWIIVAAMLSTGPMTQMYAFIAYPFPDRISCKAFAKLNYTMVTTIASSEFDGQEVEQLYCVPKNMINEMRFGQST